MTDTRQYRTRNGPDTGIFKEPTITESASVYPRYQVSRAFAEVALRLNISTKPPLSTYTAEVNRVNCTLCLKGVEAVQTRATCCRVSIQLRHDSHK